MNTCKCSQTDRQAKTLLTTYKVFHINKSLQELASIDYIMYAHMGVRTFIKLGMCSVISNIKGTSRQRSGKGAIRKGFPLRKPRWEKTKLTIRYLYHENISYAE